ncbi:MAG: A24 family peptidase [Planctomycetota bacterium]|nr:A24 family peptidase [Planctomycetota bacterium]
MPFSQLGLPLALLVITTSGVLGVLFAPSLDAMVARVGADRPTRAWMATGLGLGWVLLSMAVVLGDCQQIPYVQPDPISLWIRLGYHGVLLALLLMATWIDLRHTEIPDGITIPGTLIGVAAATLSGDLQMIHLWMDWNPVSEQLHGGNVVIPEWIREHRHWHGLAWSTAGMACGGGLTWLVRAVSRWVLGREALGLGDVTLMAMIGSFVGWQPVLFIFLLAPFCGIVVGVLARMLTNRPFIPYGPFLATAAVLVLLAWRWIWLFPHNAPRGGFAVRNLFGDAVSLAILGGSSLAAFCGLLAIVRLYGTIPVRGRRLRDQVRRQDHAAHPDDSSTSDSSTSSEADEANPNRPASSS